MTKKINQCPLVVLVQGKFVPILNNTRQVKQHSGTQQRNPALIEIHGSLVDKVTNSSYDVSCSTH